MATYSDIIKKKIKDWNCEGLMDRTNSPKGSKIPFSSPMMNYATYGGIPRNMMTEFFGDPGCGKSTTAIDLCKQAVIIFKKEFDDEVTRLRSQLSSGNKSVKSELDDMLERGPKKVLYIDIEHSFDRQWSAKLHINEDEIDIMQPPDIPGEDILQTILEIIETGEVGFIVLDSIPSLVPRAELEKKIGEKTVAALAGILCTFCRKVVPMLTRYQTTMLCINQCRDNMDNPYVVNTPGGRAPKFYAGLRMHFKLSNPVDFLGNDLPQSAENPAGYIVSAKIVKQKTAPFDRKLGSYYLMCASGIRPDFDYAKLAVNKYGIIKKSGAWFTLCDPTTGLIEEDENGNPIKLNGIAKVYDYLSINTEYMEKLQKFILDDINGSESVEEEAATDDLPEIGGLFNE